MRKRKILALIVMVVPVVAVVTLALAIAEGNAAHPVAAQEPVQPAAAKDAMRVSGVLTGCMEDICGSQNCTANDVDLSFVETIGVIDPCENITDTGIYTFRVEFVSNAESSYDPAVYIATDGGDARTGQCYVDYLIPPLSTTLSTVDPLFGPPFWDLEENGDLCGDLVGKQETYRVVGPATISCTQENLDGSINIVTVWNNSEKLDLCNESSNKCPGTKAKCYAQDVPFEVNINQVDLALTKEASVTDIPTETGEFEYILTVSNEQPVTECYTSTGYVITDDLPIWLKVREDELTNTATVAWTVRADTSEACSACSGGCEGYGNIVEIRVLEDLLCGETAVFTLPVKLWQGDPYTDTCPEGVWPDPSDYPETISNTACVDGFEVDPVPEDDCDDADVATAVELLSFTATGDRRSIVLNWETASEIDNLGFNVYRAEAVDGHRIKINAELIPSQVPPGSPYGATYEFRDLAVGPHRTYLYWLEDVDIYGNTQLHGPVEASLSPWQRLMHLLRKVLPVKGGALEG